MSFDNWTAIVNELENTASPESSSKKGKREKVAMLLDKLRSITFVFMLNFFSTMKELLLCLQKTTTVDSIADKVNAITKKLRDLRKKDSLQVALSISNLRTLKNQTTSFEVESTPSKSKIKTES